MLEGTRNRAYWLRDVLNRGAVRKALQQLEKYYNTDSTAPVLKDYSDKAISSLLRHAADTTLFYRKYKDKNIYQFPIMNKNIIRTQETDFLSNVYEKEKLVQMSTSGSTGTPFTCYQNIEKKYRVNAETIFFNGKAGYEVGKKFIYLRSLNLKNKKNALQQWIQNEKLIDINKMDEYNIEILISKIEQATNDNGATMLAYASTYDSLRDYFKKHGFDKTKNCNLRGIISTSEILYDETREYITKAFRCSCFSRYANMENGMLGQDSPSHPNIFVINESNYFIEILDMEKDEPLKDGEIGRIVVTDLYNYAMPMIRYDTGDVGSFTYIEVNGVTKKAIKNFGGRKIDMVFDSKGNAISPHKISVSFWNFPELKQFQFIQEGTRSYKVVLNIREQFNRQEELMDTLKSILGENAKITFEVVEDIPTLNSGKRKYIINKSM